MAKWKNINHWFEGNLDFMPMLINEGYGIDWDTTSGWAESLEADLGWLREQPEVNPQDLETLETLRQEVLDHVTAIKLATEEAYREMKELRADILG